MTRSYHPRVNIDDMQAWGVCDRCLQTVEYRTLRREMKQVGDKLAWNGLLICSRPGCMDKPQQQDRKRVAIVDPVPIRNPRPGDNVPATTTIVSTWVTVAAHSGATTLAVAKTAGMVTGDTVRIINDDNEKFTTTITVLTTTSLQLGTPLVGQCTRGNMVLDVTQSGDV